ncbi:MAG: hypothetical protein GEU77_09360 [Deltaproteobacteria bacterium]|nr:hypothetical protein [Deltaproteobacteria bacterium]
MKKLCHAVRLRWYFSLAEDIQDTGLLESMIERSSSYEERS